MTQPRPYNNYYVHNEFEIKGFFEEFVFLSNFHVAPVWFEGILYPSTENAYQAAKCAIKHDRERFVELTAAASKRLGQVIPMRDDWEDVKYDIMAAVVFEKFYRHKDLRRGLLATGYRHLEEANHWGDRVWGTTNGIGKNWLGKILMRTRFFWQEENKSGVEGIIIPFEKAA